MKEQLKQETSFRGLVMNGFVALFILLLIIGAVSYIVIKGAQNGSHVELIPGIAALVVCIVCMCGFFSLEPNDANVMVFFGKYVGTFSTVGFYWVNPFISRKKLTLRARNLNVDPIKVNDKVGNPVLIGLVMVWRLKDTYKVMFDIDAKTLSAENDNATSRMNAFEKFVKIQSDAALREVAGLYAYDDNSEGVGREGELTLRSGGKEINEQLEKKLNERLEFAGIEVLEARLNYLTYAPEIAAVMLRRQQASAVIAAREKIVEGAVSMVKLALDKLSEEDIDLDEEKKAAMVSNLLVVLCADESAQPVINTGTLNH